MKSKQPLVSVLMPAYNAEAYIAEAIESILKQTYANFELIILDDASTDHTLSLIKKYAKQDKRIQWCTNASNRYIAANRNTLLARVKGTYIAWQDADDISFPERIRLQVEYLSKHPRIGIVGGYLVFLQQGNVTSVRKYAEKDEELRKHIFLYSPVAQPGAMIRKKCFDECGIYNLKYPPAEDIDMSFRIGEKWEFANIQKPVIKYRVTEGSATFKKLKHQFFSTYEIRNTFAKHSSYHRTFSDTCITYIQYLAILILPSHVAVWLFEKIRNTSQ